jgi:hypothetical protein
MEQRFTFNQVASLYDASPAERSVGAGRTTARVIPIG